MSDNGGRWSWLAAQMVLVDRHWFTTSSSDEFSRAAATLSLSASCLFTAQTQEKRLITSHTVTAPPHDFDLMFFVTCFLWGVTPRSDVDIDLSRNRKTKFRQQNMNILHDVLHSVTNNQRRGCQRCIPQTNKHTHRHMYLEPLRQGAKQLDFDWQADERRHAAVRDCGSELNTHSALFIVNLREKTNR